jgi:hypothetical protein
MPLLLILGGGQGTRFTFGQKAVLFILKTNDHDPENPLFMHAVQLPGLFFIL